MSNSISSNNVYFGSNHIHGKDLPQEHIDLTRNGTPYKKTHAWEKFGGTIGAVGTMIALGVGEDDRFICNATKAADKAFGNMHFFKNSLSGKIIGTFALSSFVVTLGSIVTAGIFSLIDNHKNKKRAARADKIADIRMQRAAIEAQKKIEAKKQAQQAQEAESVQATQLQEETAQGAQS